MRRKATAGLILVMLFLAVLPAGRNYAGTAEPTSIVRNYDKKSGSDQDQAADHTKARIGVVLNDTLYFLRLVPAPEINDPIGIPGPKIHDPIEVSPEQGGGLAEMLPGDK